MAEKFGFKVPRLLLSQYGLDAGGGERRQQKVFPWHDRLVESPSGSGKGAWKDVSEKSVGRLVSLAISEYRNQDPEHEEDISAAITAFDLQNAVAAHPRIIAKVLESPDTYSYGDKIFLQDDVTEGYKTTLDTIFSSQDMYSFLLTIRKINRERDAARSVDSRQRFDTDVTKEALQRLGKPGDASLLQGYNLLSMLFFDEVETFAYTPSVINKYESIDAAENALRTILVDAVSSFSWDTYAIDPRQTIQRFIGFMKGGVKKLHGEKETDFSSDIAFSRLVNRNTGTGISDTLAGSTNIENSTIAQMGLESLLTRIKGATADLPPIATEIFVEHALSGGSMKGEDLGILAQQYALTPEDVASYIAMVRGRVLASQSGEALPQPSVRKQKSIEGLPKLGIGSPALWFIENSEARQALLGLVRNDKTTQQRRIYEIALRATDGTNQSFVDAVRQRFPTVSRKQIFNSIDRELAKDGFPDRSIIMNATVWTAMRDQRELLISRWENATTKKRDSSDLIRLAIRAAKDVPPGGDVKRAVIDAIKAERPIRGNPNNVEENIDNALKTAMRVFFSEGQRRDWEVTSYKTLVLMPDYIRQRVEDLGLQETKEGKFLLFIAENGLGAEDRIEMFAKIKAASGSQYADATDVVLNKLVSTSMKALFHDSDEEWESLNLGTRNMYRRFRVYANEMEETLRRFEWQLSPLEKAALDIVLVQPTGNKSQTLDAIMQDPRFANANRGTVDAYIQRGVRKLFTEEEWEDLKANNATMGTRLLARKKALGSAIDSPERVIARHGDILKAAFTASGTSEQIIDQIFAQFSHMKRSKIKGIITSGVWRIATPEQRQRVRELHTSPVWDKLVTASDEVLNLLISERGYMLRDSHRAILHKAIEAAQNGAKTKREFVTAVDASLRKDPDTLHLQFELKSIDRAIRYGCNLLYGNAEYDRGKNLRSLIRHKDRQQMRIISGYPHVSQDFWDALPTFQYKRPVWKAIIEAYFFTDKPINYRQVVEYVRQQTGISISESRVSRNLDAMRLRILDRRAIAGLRESLAGTH